MDPKTYPEWQASLLKQLVSTTKAASAVGTHDISFERSIDSKFNSALTSVTDRLLALSNRLLKFAGSETDEIEDEDDLEDRWAGIVDVVDGLLERADTCVDEFTGATSKGQEQSAPTMAKITKTGKGKEKLEYNFYHANVARPQLKFKTPPDNVNGSPWRPLLKEKPNAMVPLDSSLTLDENGEESLESPQNPYRHEIVNSTYPLHVFNTDGDAIPPVPLENNDLIWVDNMTSFNAMLNDLKQASDIAVDLEHHDYRSYHGFVCLMQISTRKQDWIVDTLELREELIALNEVFTDPKIVKVFHGASSDVIWLQRDFGLYLVSLFDTFHASTVLQLPSRSLAYLLLKYANIEANKKYQLADWRIRPLPTEMLDYARSDTHYLLYIYDQIRRDLTTQSQKTNVPNLITRVLDLSRQFAMMTYTRERYDYEEGSGVDGWRKVLLSNKGPHLHSNLQLTVFKRLHQWRDGVARREDESTGYVIPNRALISLAASLPNSMQAVVAACHPVPPLVQVYAEDIAYIVAKTRKELAEEAEKAEITAAKAIHGREETLRNGVTGSTHVWYKDESVAPNGVRSVMEAVKHGTQFDVWGDRKDRLHSLILPSSEFWEPLQQEYVAKEAVYEFGGELEDIKLSVPLPPLTAQIYMTEEDVKTMGTKEDKKQDNVAALAEHPFVQRPKAEEKKETAKDGAEIIIARKMGGKGNGKRARKVYELEQEQVKQDTDLDKYVVDEPLQTKNKSKRRKGLKAKIESQVSNPPIEQFDPYKPAPDSRKSPAKSIKSHGPTAGKSMTFVTPKT